jgi:hypothetical protein
MIMSTARLFALEHERKDWRTKGKDGAGGDEKKDGEWRRTKKNNGRQAKFS